MSYPVRDRTLTFKASQELGRKNESKIRKALKDSTNATTTKRHKTGNTSSIDAADTRNGDGLANNQGALFNTSPTNLGKGRKTKNNIRPSNCKDLNPEVFREDRNAGFSPIGETLGALPPSKGRLLSNLTHIPSSSVIGSVEPLGRTTQGRTRSQDVDSKVCVNKTSTPISGIRNYKIIDKCRNTKEVRDRLTRLPTVVVDNLVRKFKDTTLHEQIPTRNFNVVYSPILDGMVALGAGEKRLIASEIIGTYRGLVTIDGGSSKHSDCCFALTKIPGLGGVVVDAKHEGSELKYMQVCLSCLIKASNTVLRRVRRDLICFLYLIG